MSLSHLRRSRLHIPQLFCQEIVWINYSFIHLHHLEISSVASYTYFLGDADELS